MGGDCKGEGGGREGEFGWGVGRLYVYVSTQKAEIGAVLCCYALGSNCYRWAGGPDIAKRHTVKISSEYPVIEPTAGILSLTFPVSQSNTLYPTSPAHPIASEARHQISFAALRKMMQPIIY